MRDRQSSFWFPVKSYGWGWGLPVRWRGWAVLLAYLALQYFGIRYFPEQRNFPVLLTYMVGLTVLLVVIVIVKGERPAAWGWGGK